MGLLGLAATGICSMLGAAINVVPFMLQRNVPGIGPDALPAYLFATVPAVLAALAYAMLASAMPRAGGSYVYASRSLNPYLGFVASFSQWFGLCVAIGVVSYVLIPFLRDIATALSWAGMAATLDSGPVRVGLALAFLWTFVAVNLRGVKLYERTLVPMMFVMFALGAIVIMAGFSFDQADFAAALAERGETVPAPPASPFKLWTFLAASAILFSSFIGFDSIAQAGGEALAPIPGDCGDEYRRPPFLTASGDLSHHFDEFPPPYTPVEGRGGDLRVLSGTPWEELAGYCRAVRRGRRISVSGTTASNLSKRRVSSGGIMTKAVMLPSTLALLLLAAIACGDAQAPVPVSQRLVDVFEPQMVDGEAPATPPPPPTEWRFDGPPPEVPPESWAATRGWQPLRGIEGLAVRDGRLVGEATDDLPMLRFERVEGVDDDDPLYEIQVRMKATAGQRLGVHFAGHRNALDEAIAAGQTRLWPVGAFLGGTELTTHTFKTPFPVRSSDIREIFLRPTDAPGARFEIESVRLVFRRELLAAKPTGIGWEALSDTYRETVVARAPESIRWRLTLPERPRLVLSLGTLDETPVTFRVTLEDGDGGAPRTLTERTLTTPERWQPLALDLDDAQGHEVTLTLALEAEEEGTLGLWGSPALRARVAPRAARRVANGDGAQPQGVIFILADTLRPDHLEAFGHERPTAPTVARLADEGARFHDAQAQATWTKVSTPALFSSLYPVTSGVVTFPDRLPSSATTMAEVFRQAGYATLGYSSIQFTGKFSNMHQGYEALHEVYSLGYSKTARGFVDRLLPWLEAHRDERFFVFLHVFDPHSPYEPDPPYNSRWADPAWHSQHRRDKERFGSIIQDPIRQLIKMPSRDEVLSADMDPEAFIERELAWYDGSIRGMDRELERVFERLRELGLDERTLVVFASDHGDEFHDHGSMVHGHSVYDELTRVPLVLWYPGVVPAGAEIDETVQLIDVMPTVLELAGLPIPAAAQGQSLVPLMAAAGGEPVGNGSSWRPRPAISQRPPFPFPSIPPAPAAESTSLIFEGWKLIHNLEPLPETPEYELYDHVGDPRDQVDVAAQNPEVVERLAAMLEQWREQATAARLPSDAEIQEDLSTEELERLRSLGYEP